MGMPTDCKAEPYFRFVVADCQKTNHFAMVHTKDILNMKPLRLIFHQEKYKILMTTMFQSRFDGFQGMSVIYICLYISSSFSSRIVFYFTQRVYLLIFLIDHFLNVFIKISKQATYIFIFN